MIQYILTIPPLQQAFFGGVLVAVQVDRNEHAPLATSSQSCHARIAMTCGPLSESPSTYSRICEIIPALLLCTPGHLAIHLFDRTVDTA